MSNEITEPVNEVSLGGVGELDNILNDLHNGCPDVELSMVATQDGLTMTSLGTVHNPDDVGAHCAELRSICYRAAKKLEQGVLEQMLLRCSDGYMLVTTAGDNAILAVMTKPDSNLGLIFIEAERAAASIKRVLS